MISEAAQRIASVFCWSMPLPEDLPLLVNRIETNISGVTAWTAKRLPTRAAGG
jgi:hypothetical protein